MKKMLKEKELKNWIILVLLVVAFIVGFLNGAIFGVKSTVNNLVEFLEDSSVDIDINFNETRMIETMMDAIKDDPRFTQPQVPLVDVTELQKSRLPKPEEPDVPELI